MAHAGAAAPAVNSQGSCARGGGSVRAQSGLGQAETGVQARARIRRATTGQRYWWLSRAGRKLWQWQSAVTTVAAGTEKLRETAAAVAGTAAAEAGTQGFTGTAEAGRGNEKCEC